MAIDLRDISLFVAAYEERSFTAAAKREFTTQPGISQHIRKIEERLGTQLFIRGSTAIEATPAGDLYYRKCIEILKMHAEVMEELTNYKGGLSGEIRVGLMQSITRTVLAPTLAGFMEQHPNVTVRSLEAFAPELIQKVRSGDLDFAIVPSFLSGVREPGLKSRRFINTPEFLVSRNNNTIKPLTPVRLADLGPLRMIVPPIQNMRRGRLDEYFHRNNVIIERRLEIDASNAWQDFVAHTNWVAILPGLLVMSDIDKPNITLSPIIDPPLMLELVLIQASRGVMPLAAEKFIEHLRAETIKLNDKLLRLLGEVPVEDNSTID